MGKIKSRIQFCLVDMCIALTNLFFKPGHPEPAAGAYKLRDWFERREGA